VLSWQTAPLDHDVTLSGAVVAKLFASTTGRDADWVVKLLDVYPDDAATPAELRGHQRMIANDVFRGRYRKSYEKPEALTPGAVLDYKIDLHSASHVFKKGHRIAVQVQSSWFPLIDRNPQTWVPNIFNAKPGDFVAQTHKVYHTTRYPSSIEVSIGN
jgi:putative CocE/NonD family hydrolase